MSPKKKARLNDTNNPLNPTDSVLNSFEQVSKSTSQQVNKSNGHNSSQSTPQPVPSLRKATFKIDNQVLDSLDRYHLQLQMDLGKRNAPFKEIIVELALKNILQQAQTDPEQLLQLLQQQQRIRS